jgi:quercetin dioxygenase-like cupin family protein
MLFPAWLRPHRVLVAVVAVVTGVLACKDTTTPKQFSTDGIAEPRFTAAVGFTSTPIGRGNLGTFHSQSHANGYQVALESHNNTDIAVANVTITPAGHSGWHSHPGPVIVVVKTGTVTFYHGNDPTCTGTVHPAGTVFIEEGGDVGIARNEGAVEVNNVVTFFVPAGSPTRIDAANPGNCPF